MITVGLTGGIGAGKTFIANEFKKLGIPVYNSDTRAKELMVTNSSIRHELTKIFGNNTYINNSLNRKLIADKIFRNKSLISKINSIVHPAVFEDYNLWKLKQNSPFVIKEAAILIESGAYKQCNKIIVVTAPLKLRIQRVVKRDNMTQKQVEDRINNQISDAERVKYANYIIKNDGTNIVKKQVIEIYSKILVNR